jgi:hypothetical protein
MVVLINFMSNHRAASAASERTQPWMAHGGTD